MEKIVTIGFDGFIDTLVKPIKTVLDNGDIYFENIKDFGEFIASKANISCSIELFETSRSLGGNMPHVAKSLAKKGINVNAVGMLGKNFIKDEFKELVDLCNVYSFADEGVSTNFEFNDGKVFFAPKITINDDVFKRISEIFDVDIFSKSDAFVLTNYSELNFSYKLWKDIYENVFLNECLDKNKFLFFDFCDFSRKSDIEVKNVINLVEKFSEKRTTILSLNENEAQILAKIYEIYDETLENKCKKIGEILKIDEIVIHTTKESVLSTKDGVFSKKTEYIEKPVISTGSGDNFNASFIYAKLLDKKPYECLKIANYGAYFYVKNGVCATDKDMDCKI